jgi:hypothetical protein
LHTGDGLIGGPRVQSGVSPATAALVLMATTTATATETPIAASRAQSPPTAEALLGTFGVVVLAALLLRRFR